jgi:hypothetical protein
LIEVVGHRTLSRQQTKAAPGGIGGVVGPGQAGDLHQRLAGFADHEAFAGHRLRHEPGEMGLGLVQVDLAQGRNDGF